MLGFKLIPVSKGGSSRLFWIITLLLVKIYWMRFLHQHCIVDLMQDCSNSSLSAMELQQSCSKHSMCICIQSQCYRSLQMPCNWKFWISIRLKYGWKIFSPEHHTINGVLRETTRNQMGPSQYSVSFWDGIAWYGSMKNIIGMTPEHGTQSNLTIGMFHYIWRSTQMNFVILLKCEWCVHGDKDAV